MSSARTQYTFVEIETPILYNFLLYFGIVLCDLSFFHFMIDTHILVRVYHNTDICIVIIGLGTMVFNATFNDISAIS